MSTINRENESTSVKQTAEILHAFLECSDEIQQSVKEMLQIVYSGESDDDEIHMALATIADALFLNPYKSKYGMDLLESEKDASAEYPEIAEIVEEMDREEEGFAERLQNAMDLRGLNQAKLAILVGIGQPAISNMLNRQCRPQKRTIEKLANALNISATELWPY